MEANPSHQASSPTSTTSQHQPTSTTNVTTTRSQTSPQQQQKQQQLDQRLLSPPSSHQDQSDNQLSSKSNSNGRGRGNSSNSFSLLGSHARPLPPSFNRPGWPQRHRNIVSILQKPELKRALLKFVREQELGDNGGEQLVIGVERVKKLESVVRRLGKKPISLEDTLDSDSDFGSEEEEMEIGGVGGVGGASSIRKMDKGVAGIDQQQQQTENQRERDLSFLLDLSLTLHWALRDRIHSLISPSTSHNPYSASPPRPPPPSSLLSLQPLLESLARNSLSDQDFPGVDGVSEFPSNAGGEVKMVRNKFLDCKALALNGNPIEGNGNGLICVMKSTGKAAARMHRSRGRMRVDLETKVLLASSRGFKAQSDSHADSKVRDSEIPTPLLVASFQSDKKLHLVMEYLPHGDLDSFLISANDGKRKGIGLGKGTISKHQGQLLEEKFLLSFARDMVEAIGWLHGLGIVHRDIKPANFLISPSGHLKLCDFAGSAPYSTFTPSQLEAALPPSPRRQLKRDQRDPRDASWRPTGCRRVLAYYLQLPCGTPDYMAPEVLKSAEERHRIDNYGEYDDEESDEDFVSEESENEGGEMVAEASSVALDQMESKRISMDQEGENFKPGKLEIKRRALGLPRSNSLPEGIEYSLSAVPKSSSYTSNLSATRSRSRLAPLDPSSPTASITSFPRSRSYNEIASSSSPSSRIKSRSKNERLMGANGPRADSGVGMKGKNPKSSQILPTASSSSSSLNSRASKRAKILTSISSSNSSNSIKSSRSVVSSSSSAEVAEDQQDLRDCSFDTKVPPINALVPGSYGPEVDFWCLGLILHECAFGSLPFAEPPELTDRNLIAGYIQYAITNCETTFKLDRSVPLSPEFHDLISGLICLPSKRLGRNSTDEIKNHPFFRGTDWSKIWQLEAAYVPHSGASAVGAEMANASHLSPGLQQQVYDSFVSEVPTFSQIFQGGIEDFPEFPDPSFVQIQQEREASIHHQANVTEGEISEVLLSKTIAPPPPSTRAAFPPSWSTQGLAARWADIPLELVGFSYLPPPEAFGGTVSSSGDVSTQLQPATHDHSRVSVEASSAKPPVRFSGVPPTPGPSSRFSQVASTPYGKGPGFGKGLPQSTPYQATPYHSGTVPRTLQRRAIEAAASRAEGLSAQYVTPLRKTSMPNVTSAFMSTPAPHLAENGSQQLHVPPSPYPFPASAQRVVSASGVAHNALRRNDLDRARSSTPGTGSLGSDSRCSGGSNAKRDVSEKDAYDDIMSAIKKSAIKSTRKKKPIFGDREKAVKKSNPAQLLRRIRETQRPEDRSLADSSEAVESSRLVSRPPLTHAATDTNLLSGPTSCNHQSNGSQTNSALVAPQVRPGAVSAPPSGELQSHDIAPVRIGALGGALMGFRLDRPRPPPILTRRPPSPGSGGIARGSIDISSEDELECLSALSSPDGDRIGISTFLAPNQLENDQATSGPSSDGANNTLTSNKPQIAGRLGLRKQHSARQLLLKAQERATPTKPTRATSPSLTVAFSERDLALPRAGTTDAMVELQTASPQRIESEIARMDMELPSAWNDPLTSKPRPASMAVRKGELNSNQDSNRLAATTEMNRSRSISRRKSASELPQLERRTTSVGRDPGANAIEESQPQLFRRLGDISNSASVSSLDTSEGKRMKRRSSREMLSEYRLSGKNSPSPTFSSPSVSSLANVTEDAFFSRAESPTIGSSSRDPSRSLRRASFANFGAIKSSHSQQAQSLRPTSQAIPRRGSSTALGKESFKEDKSKLPAGAGRSTLPTSASTAAAISLEQEQTKVEKTLPPKRSSKWDRLGAALGRGSSNSNNSNNDRNPPSVSTTSSSKRPPVSATAAVPSNTSSRAVSAPLPKRVRALANLRSDSSNSDSTVGDDTADMSLGTGIVHKFGKWDSELSGAGRKAEKLIAHLSKDPRPN